MAELTSNEPSPTVIFGKAGPKSCKSDLNPGSAGTSPLNPHQLIGQVVFVRYLDHVLYSRSLAIAMKPQTREALGWLIYDCEQYVIVCWDRDADPPTLRGGDPKASGLVLLKSDIIALERLRLKADFSHEDSKRFLNSPKPTGRDEYAFRPTERKTHSLSTKGEKKP
jgi:hypothetical protein